jgi:hypothetical protein
VSCAPINQRRGDGRIDAAREPKDHFLCTDIGSDPLDRLADMVAHDPVGAALADVEHEAAQDRLALQRMRDFRMELHTVEMARLVRHAGNRARLGRRHQCESRRHLHNLVAMAHPDVQQAMALGAAVVLDAFEQARMATRPDLGVAELPSMSSLDPAAELLCHRLHAVADAQHRHAQLEYR